MILTYILVKVNSLQNLSGNVPGNITLPFFVSLSVCRFEKGAFQQKCLN